MLEQKSQKPAEKKRVRVFVYSVFTLVYSWLFSLATACFLELTGICFAVSLDGRKLIERYPRFIPFCLILGVLTVVVLVFLTVLNVKKSKMLGYTKSIWWLQYVFAVLVSVPLLFLWEPVFDFLQKTF